jgi:Gly-Xaa carboxypeptidase
MTGNTDTVSIHTGTTLSSTLMPDSFIVRQRYYWDLTKNIYRFTPIDRARSINLHTVDERLLFDDHIDAVW